MHKKRLSRIRTWLLMIAAVSFLFLDLAGCSVYMAVKQPSKKNLEVMNIGTPRSLVLAEFGQPAAAETRDGKKVDVFSFVQGYSQGAKTGRAVFHGVADFMTLGMWEVVGTPAEAVLDGTKVVYEITYDPNDRVEKVVPLTEKSKQKAPQEVAVEPLPSKEKPKEEAEKQAAPDAPKQAVESDVQKIAQPVPAAEAMKEEPQKQGEVSVAPQPPAAPEGQQ
jgi:hypothetical protein